VQVLRGIAVISFALVLVWLAVGRGWDAPSSLQLIRVTDFAPREVEPGDHIAIFGEGFPSGRPARVTFRGILHRPGAVAQKGAEVSVWGTVVAPDRIEVAFDDAAQALFCGVGERAIHTTFEGDLEVAFASALPGAPPIAGFLGGVTVDVRPGPSPGGAERDREAERLLAFLGLRLAAKPHGGGLLVDTVEPDSRAQAAGIAAGDTLESFDGVRVRSPGDVMPASDEHDSTVTLRRVSLADPLVRSVCVTGFRPELPAGWVTSALLVFGALGIVLFFAAPAPTSLSTWIQFAIGRVRERLAASRAPRSLRGAVALAWAEVGQEVMPAGPLALIDAAACALIAMLPFGNFRLASTLDVGILFMGSATALVAASLVSARPLASRVRRALHVGWQHAPALAAIACAVLATGSFRLQEIARAQGGSPWEWLVFRSPAAPIALALLLSCMRIDFVGEGLRGAREVRESHFLHAVSRAHRIVVAGLASVLFLGAWSLPGVTVAEQDAHPPLQLAGVGCLMAKTAVVLLGMACSRWALVPLPLGRRSWAATLWLIPSGAVAFGAMAFWSLWGLRPALQATMTGSLLISAALVGAALAHRLHRGLLSGANEARLSPFL
jgi:NADH-quinone oxidoreductase subunit H